MPDPRPKRQKRGAAEHGFEAGMVLHLSLPGRGSTTHTGLWKAISVPESNMDGCKCFVSTTCHSYCLMLSVLYCTTTI